MSELPTWSNAISFSGDGQLPMTLRRPNRHVELRMIELTQSRSMRWRGTKWVHPHSDNPLTSILRKMRYSEDAVNGGAPASIW